MSVLSSLHSTGTQQIDAIHSCSHKLLPIHAVALAVLVVCSKPFLVKLYWSRFELTSERVIV